MAHGMCSVVGCSTVGHLRRGWCGACYEWSRSHGGANPEGRPRRARRGSLQELMRAAAHAETNECIILTHKGAGQATVRVDGAPMNASRAVWILRYGDPGEAYVLHSCNGGSGAHGCINIRHLRAGDPSENLIDRADSGVQIGERNCNASLKDEQVREIRSRAGVGETHQSLADEFGIARQTVSKMVARITWRRLS